SNLFISCMIVRYPQSTLFPYTTLFRSSEHPEVAAGSSNKYQNWEVVDPEKWVPQGYACLRIDSRGAGRSPGRIEHFAPRETQDRSEEHTSELQSPDHLVCRLLLEKKK